MEIKTNDYNQLIDFCKAVAFAETDMVYGTELNHDIFTVYAADMACQLGEKILEYTFECDEIRTFMYELLEDAAAINDGKTYTKLVFINSSNHYHFLMNPFIFELILTAEYLKSQNIPISHTFKMRSKSGKIRDITAPNDAIKPALQSLNKLLQHTYDKRNSVFQVAYKTGKSIKDNAKPHKDNQYMFKIDLHDFFPSCKRSYVETYIQFLFKNTINSAFVREKFLDIVLLNDALYIGNPISGTLANAIISKPVAYMKNICDKFGMTFTVYADDMTFSSNKFIAKDFIISIFNKAFVRYNMENDFSLSEKKCYGVSKANRSSTGVALNHRNEVTCHRKIYSTIRQTLHQLSYGDTSHFNFNKLQGQIAFMSMVDESGKLKTLLTKYKNIVLQYKLVSQDKLTSMGI